MISKFPVSKDGEFAYLKLRKQVAFAACFTFLGP